MRKTEWTAAFRRDYKRVANLHIESGWVPKHTRPDELEAAIRSAGAVLAPEHPVTVIARSSDALRRISQLACADGWTVIPLGPDIEGDAAETGRAHAARTMEYAGKPGRYLLVSGGELTVRVSNPDGRGGPNLEYLAALMEGLPSGAPVAALACDSDGIDGTEDNAGGYFDATHRASAEDCAVALRINQSYDLFKRLGGLIRTGPTLTNINDIRLIAVGALP